jgi:hypothetical protein
MAIDTGTSKGSVGFGFMYNTKYWSTVDGTLMLVAPAAGVAAAAGCVAPEAGALVAEGAAVAEEAAVVAVAFVAVVDGAAADVATMVTGAAAVVGAAVVTGAAVVDGSVVFAVVDEPELQADSTRSRLAPPAAATRWTKGFRGRDVMAREDITNQLTSESSKLAVNLLLLRCVLDRPF